MDKPTKPTNLMPRSFGGVKNNFSTSLQSSGYEDGVPAIYGGDNLNYQLDATGKELDYCEKICDFINALPIGKSITTDANNKLVYTNIVDAADISLDNLTEEGEKHFLNKQQVTNCLLEVPQRINYTLVDGALTLLQGSVLTIPFGTTDLSSTYTVGSTFINSGLKVVDRKYNNGQFFVWAELQSDLVRASSSSTSVAQRTAVVQIASNLLSIGNFANTASVSSDTDATQSSVAFYNTSTNLMKTKSSGTISDNTVSLPIMITESDTTYNIAKIKQVFNGFGFIGKVAWADKGIKFLAPNGLNADGSLNNSELTLTNISIRDLGTEIGVNNTRYLTINAARQINVASLEILYDCYRNVNYRSSTGAVYSNSVIGMLSTDADYNISRLVVETALNINMISDGRWIGKLATLVYNATFQQNDPAVKYSLANYLPDDGFCYEVLFVAYVNTQGNNNEFSAVRLTSDILDPTLYIPVAFARSRTGDPIIEDLDFTGNAIIPVGTGRYVQQYSPTSIAANGKYSLFAYAYRRLGSNI